ncbi:MAG: polysaccharide deacetylase family protein [Gemmataceae bacterium]
MLEATAGADEVRVSILTYHSIDDSGSVISVPPATFRRQMTALARRGYSGVTLSHLLDVWDGKADATNRVVAVTFDDGFANLSDHALPVLAELGFGATIFAVQAYAGRHNDWPSQPPGVPRLPLLTAARLRDCVAAGMEVGHHTATHPPLDALGPAEVRAELVNAKHALEDALGGPVRTFAYPYGRLPDPAGEALVRDHFRAACGVRLRAACPVDDRYRLPRVDMYYFRPPMVCEWYGTSRGQWYLRARGVGRTLRRFSR